MGRYTTADDVASLLGRVFTDEQSAVADRVITAAEIWVDQQTRKVYGVNAQRSERFFRNPGPLLKLKNVPVVSIDGVFTKTSYSSAEAQLDPSSYDIQDAEQGLIYVSALEGNAQRYPIVRVSYTADATIPSNVKLGTEYLTAHWLRPTLVDEMPGVSQFSLGGEEAISYTDLVKQYGVPAEVWAILGVNSGGDFYIA